MKEGFTTRFEDGLQVGGKILHVSEEVPGRIIGHTYVKLYVELEGHNDLLMYVGLYEGRPPYYLPWIELFEIEPTIHGEPFFGSTLEDILIEICSDISPPGGRLFVEYTQDRESIRQLTEGVPPPFSRLGSLMLKHGFTWFKDWYFAEGFNEGSQKLQGEKPLDEIKKKEHLERIRASAIEYMDNEKYPTQEVLARIERFLDTGHL